ncbi:prealbumin-like fold domain-containing protein [Leucobacter salsicius]|uniref:prealbumin-like fold domain-containing protein n=1 Tax=Leucobacter salsicius TaxID=664638 RepID=UPI00036AB813|nr:prealbumin-like fold domain-containing protein [Leucobacter salsicius]
MAIALSLSVVVGFGALVADTVPGVPATPASATEGNGEANESVVTAELPVEDSDGSSGAEAPAEEVAPAEEEAPVEDGSEIASEEGSDDDGSDAAPEETSGPVASETDSSGDAAVPAPKEPSPQAEALESLDAPSIGTFAMPTGRNYLTWEVTDAANSHVGGATVNVQGPRTTNWWGTVNWGSVYNVTDCTSDPCHANSMDQDPRPGYFAVDNLNSFPAGGGVSKQPITANSRYRIQPVGSIIDYNWTISTANWIEIPGTDNSPDGWPATGPWEFNDLKVEPRASVNYCMVEPANSYYSLNRNSATGRTTSIRRVTHNQAETSITAATALVPDSTVTVPSEATANGLGITPTGVFYFASQIAPNRQVTTYRFDPQVDTAPYPVWTMDLLSPVAGYLVAGDATVYDGAEEFYYAYFSSSPNNISGRSALRMHVYRYSAGNGERTGEVSHVDVERPVNFTTNANAMNGDFAFDGANNLQFIMSDTAGGYTVSGSVSGNELHSLPGSHVLQTVPTIIGNGIGGRLPAGQREAINGVAYTQGGRALIQQGNINSFANPTTMQIFGNRTSLTGVGTLVDLASCAEPTTISVQKNLVGDRFAPGDQFQLNASRTAGGTTSTFDSVTTTGASSGIQSQQIGPYAMVFDGTFRASETVATNGSNYATTWACYVGSSTTPFLDGTGRSLEFALSSTTHSTLVPGSNIRCVFTNETLRPSLTIEKTSDPASGETVTAGTIVDYTLTFANTAGTAAATVDHIDHLGDVLDDADFVDAAGNVVTTPVITTPGTPGLSANWNSTNQQIDIAGNVPATETRTVTFRVKVKANTENSASRENVAAPLAGYWLRNYLTPRGVTPPASCEAPAEGELATCAEHPIPAWTVSKGSFPADGALIHTGGNVNYRVTVSKLNGGAGDWNLEGVAVTDDLTDVMKSAGWTPGVTVPSGARSIGIYLFETATGGAPTVLCQGEADGGVDCVPAPTITAGSGTAPYFDSTWTLTTREFNMPANIVRAEVWYTVTAGQAPEVPGAWAPGPIQWGTSLTNSATADSTTQDPQQCITGVDETFNADECQVTQRIESGFFTIRKDGVSASGVETNLTGHRFEVRDDNAGQMNSGVSAQMCTAQDWGSSGYTGTIPAVPWNVDPASYQGAPAECAYLYPIESGSQEGRWRSQNLPTGTYWLVETQAAVGHQLLAEPVKFSVADAAGEGKLTAYDSSGNALSACSSTNPNATACVNPTGWLMVIQDPRMAALPLAGGMNLAAGLSIGAIVLLTGTLGAAWVMRRRNQTRSSRAV